MWILRDTNNRPTNNMAKFRSGKFSGLLRNVVFLGVFGVWVIRESTVVLDLVIRVAPRGFEQIELLGATEGLEDSIDAPTQVFSLLPLGFSWPGRVPPLTERNVRSAYSGYFSKKRATNSRFAVVAPCP